MATKKTLPKYSHLTYRCGVCGAEIYPCENYCDECYSEIDWDNYTSQINNENQDEKLFEMSALRESDKKSYSNQ